ncbi:MAG: hypothetical protein QOD75_39 [Blastocatellia bacterium]|nr:hypothetical protein [Blastocatellia bacterium]
MSHDEELISELSDLSPAEPQGFKPEEMVTCDACLRANPPTRTNCLYCLVVLPAPGGAIDLRQPALRPLEQWERGFNTVLAKPGESEFDEKTLSEIATLLRQETVVIRQIFECGQAMPLSRAASLEEAFLIENRLRALNVETIIVSDADLEVEKAPPKRIRALDLDDTSIQGREPMAGATLKIASSDILLLVTGRLLVTSIEVEENKFRSGEPELIESRELSDDEPVVDIFTAQKDGGWRIAARSFDFSCLGERKTLMSGENFGLLLEQLRERAPNASFDYSYPSLRKLLNAVWPLVQQTEGRGWRRARPGKYNVAAVTTVNNETQFTRYARLLQYLKLQDQGQCLDL